MGGCASKLLQDDVGTERYSKHGQWSQPGLGEALGAGGFGMGAAAAAPTNYSTTANVGLGRGEERVFLRDPPVGGLQLPRIEEDQAQQGQESPIKSQLTVPVSAQHLGGGGEKGMPAQQQPLNWTRGELIGQGAFGSVYLGMDNDSGQLMAVKQVHINKAAGDRGGKLAENLRSLEAEVQLLQQLNHANIVRYLGTERTEAALNIFLEYVPGGSIASLLAKFGSFRESVIKVYTKQILLGLEYLHQNGIMHRDIKGANILVDNTGLVKLADFGASKKIEDLVTIEEGYKTMKGTPNWMAPEVITGTGHGRQADIWSVACTVIEMATGRPPWSQFGSQVSAMFHIASSKGPPTIPENLSPDCKDFLYLCFNRIWKERPSASRLLQHSFLADVICRTVAAPLNNIANVVQEPSMKAWRAPKSVRVPSPMREESEGLPFSTPSPLHPRIAERAVGAARISTATSQGGSEGDTTPGAAVAGGGGAAQIAGGVPELPLSPLGQPPGGRKQKASVAGGAVATPRATAGAGVQQQQGRLPQRSPGKPRPSLRASAPALRGYASVALANAGGVTPRPDHPPQLEQEHRPAVVINSAASTVQPLDSVRPDAPQLGKQSSGTLSRESSLAIAEAATAALRASGSLRSSQEQPMPAGADRVTVEQGPPASTAVVAAAAYEVHQESLRPQEAETPIPAKRAAHSRHQTAATGAGLPGVQESCTPSTGDSRGTFKSDYNPMEEPSWMHSLESPIDEGALCCADGSPKGMHSHPSEATPQPAGAQHTSNAVAPAEARAQPPQQAEQEQHHMVWMDDDGSIDALPWDIGSWSVGSKDGSPAEAGQGGTTAAAVAAASPGEPVGQEVLMTALNRRAHLEVRASLALFESTLKSLNVPKLLAEGTPSPKGPGKLGTLPALNGAAAASQAAVTGPKAACAAPALIAQQGPSAGNQLPAPKPQLAGPGMLTYPSKEDLASLEQPGGQAGLVERRQAVPCMGAYPGAMPEPAPGGYGGREAVWEQELSRELSQFGQLPSQWRYTAGRRASMHGSPQKAALAAGQQ